MPLVPTHHLIIEFCSNQLPVLSVPLSAPTYRKKEVCKNQPGEE